MHYIEQGRNLVVCCDGTGNVWKPGPGKTNVVKLIEALIHDPERQLHFYDPGVGTPDGYISESGQALRDVARRIAGLVWGDGVWTNVADAYEFLVQNYRPHDRIFLFGFSRGAFTARAVSGLIYLFGILRPEHANLIPTLLSVYRTKPESKTRPRPVPKNPRDKPTQTRADIGASIKAAFSVTVDDTPIHFIGVWDTVESVGMDQLALGAHITSDPTVRPTFQHVRHALALDELRWPYRPRLYTIPAQLPTEHTAKQVWFAGAHSDVGGGYADDGIANAALHWMVREAYAHGLRIDLALLQQHAINPLATLHDEPARMPVWSAVGTFLRDYPTDICVHESVVVRMKNPATKYAPPIPENFTTEFTLMKFSDALGNIAQLDPPPTAPPVPAEPPRDRIAAWYWLWLVISAGATVWALAQWHEDQFALARLQITQGWFGHLGEILAAWHSSSAASVGDLLRADTIAILCYASLLPALAFLLQRLAARNGALGSRTGKVLLYSGLLLPLSDFFENLLTYLSVRGFENAHWYAMPCSFATALASTGKFVFLLAFVGAAVSCIVKFFKRCFG